MGDIVSTSQATTYYSPKAEHITVNVADDALSKDAHAKGNFNLCEGSWVGCLCDARHRILLGLVGADGCVVWHHGLFRFDRSSVLTWSRSKGQGTRTSSTATRGSDLRCFL